MGTLEAFLQDVKWAKGSKADHNDNLTNDEVSTDVEANVFTKVIIGVQSTREKVRDLKEMQAEFLEEPFELIGKENRKDHDDDSFVQSQSNEEKTRDCEDRPSEFLEDGVTGNNYPKNDVKKHNEYAYMQSQLSKEEARDLAEDTASFLLRSWWDSTLRQYRHTLEKWVLFCQWKQADPFHPPIAVTIFSCNYSMALPL